MYQQILQKINEQCPWLLNEESETEVNYTVCGKPAKHKVLKKGRPPELAELLYAMSEKTARYELTLSGTFIEHFESGSWENVIDYDLTKSLRENIETNPELGKFLLEVLV